MKNNPLLIIVAVLLICFATMFAYVCSSVETLSSTVTTLTHRLVDIETDVNNRINVQTLKDIRDIVKEAKASADANGRKGTVILIKLDKIIEEQLRR